jgi:hypothetical protein
VEFLAQQKHFILKLIQIATMKGNCKNFGEGINMKVPGYVSIIILLSMGLSTCTSLHAGWFSRTKHANPTYFEDISVDLDSDSKENIAKQPLIPAKEILKKLKGFLNSTYRKGLYQFIQDYSKYTEEEQKEIIDMAIEKGKASKVIRNGFAETALIAFANTLKPLGFALGATLIVLEIAMPVLFLALFITSIMGGAEGMEGAGYAFGGYYCGGPYLTIAGASTMKAAWHSVEGIISKCDIHNKIYVRKPKPKQKTLINLASFLYQKNEYALTERIYREILGPKGQQKRIPGKLRHSLSYLLMINKIRTHVIESIPYNLIASLEPDVQSFIDAAQKNETGRRQRERLNQMWGGTSQLLTLKKMITHLRNQGFSQLTYPHKIKR